MLTWLTSLHARARACARVARRVPQSHKDCPVELQFIKEPDRSVWKHGNHTDAEGHTGSACAPTILEPRAVVDVPATETWEGKGLAPEWQTEVEALLMSGKGPKAVRIELLVRYDIGGATSDVAKYGRIPSKEKIKSHADSMRSNGLAECVCSRDVPIRRSCTAQLSSPCTVMDF